MAKTNIDWCDRVWNPIVGCSRISHGCDNCYAARMANRLNANPVTRGKYYHCYKWDGSVSFDNDHIDDPLHWRKPSRIFVNSMGDLFHENVPDEWLDKVFSVMAVSKIRHTFLVLTKRTERMHKYICGLRVRWIDFVSKACQLMEQADLWYDVLIESGPIINELWLGVSIEDQPTAYARIGDLLRTPAAHRFISYEPALGSVDITPYLQIGTRIDNIVKPDISWVIAGGENGPGARPCHPDWLRSLRDQCSVAGVPFFFKGWGEWGPADANIDASAVAKYHYKWPVDGSRFLGACSYRIGKKRSGWLLDGKEYREIPA